MKETLCTVLGVIGSICAGFFGGWDTSIKALLLFMLVDLILGFTCAGMKKSSKSKSGGLQSNACWIGLCRKLVTLMLVVVSVQLDTVLGVSYIRDAVCITFMVNELISIVENVGLMGIKLPEPLMSAIDILQKKSEHEETKKKTEENKTESNKE